MAPRHGGVVHPSAQDYRQRLAGDIAAANHRRARAVHRHPIVSEQGQDSAGSAGDEGAPLSTVKARYAGAGNAVHVLERIDRVEQRKVVDSFGQRKLDQDARDRGVAVEPLDHLHQPRGGRLLHRHFDQPAGEPQIRTVALFVAHVLA